MNSIFFFFAIPICIADLSSFFIPNIYTKTLLLFTFFNFCFFGLEDISHLIASFLTLLVLALLGVGMGDVKILGIFLVTNSVSSFNLITYLFAAAFLHIVILIVLKRSIPSKIALAPSIFVAVATLLATS